MKFGCFLMLLMSPVFSFSQDLEPYDQVEFKRSPFKEDGSMIDCPRDWMMLRERMDSLKREVKHLEEQFIGLTQNPVDLTSGSFVKLYESEYEIRIEAWGEVNELFCVSDNEAGNILGEIYGSPITLDPIKSYGKYLVITRKSYYLGNCQKLTTMKEYYVRKD